MLGVLLMQVREEIRKTKNTSNESSNSNSKESSSNNNEEKPAKKQTLKVDSLINFRTSFELRQMNYSKLQQQPFDYYIVLGLFIPNIKVTWQTLKPHVMKKGKFILKKSQNFQVSQQMPKLSNFSMNFTQKFPRTFINIPDVCKA